jgi:hypothetical protein
VVQPQHPPAAATRGGTVAVYSNIYCASLRAVNPPNLLCKEYGKLVALILQSIACLTRV